MEEPSLTFDATAKMATPWRMGCHAPMSWAFSGTMRRNWVTIFQASTRISKRLLTRARTGARGKEATNRVTKPNWITVGKSHADTKPNLITAEKKPLHQLIWEPDTMIVADRLARGESDTMIVARGDLHHIVYVHPTLLD